MSHPIKLGSCRTQTSRIALNPYSDGCSTQVPEVDWTDGIGLLGWVLPSLFSTLRYSIPLRYIQSTYSIWVLHPSEYGFKDILMVWVLQEPKVMG